MHERGAASRSPPSSFSNISVSAIMIGLAIVTLVFIRW